MRGFNIAEQGHVVNALVPQSETTGSCAGVSLANYSRVQFVVAIGASTAAYSGITVEECSASDGTGAAAIAFNYYAETTDGGDVLSAKTAATTSGFAGSANDNIFYVIDVQDAELSDDKPFVRVTLTGGTAVLTCVIAILSGARHGAAESASVLT